MPGNRLNHQDRQHIADGLTAGLSYAEIAVQLRRPTSTISREVARNGGRDAYRAEHAHLATAQRAHRIHHTSTSAPPPAPAPLRDFREQFTAMMVATGLPRMPAQVLVCLLTAENDGLPAAELAADLRVSPASISKAVLYLEQLRLIKRERDTHRRRERYLIDDDIWYQASTREVQTCAAWAGAARQGAELLADTPAGNRMAEMAQYFHHVGQDLARSAQHWHDTLTSRRTGRPDTGLARPEPGST